jgi:hypothetical protein
MEINRRYYTSSKTFCYNDKRVAQSLTGGLYKTMSPLLMIPKGVGL